jgi:hypothetical protein
MAVRPSIILGSLIIFLGACSSPVALTPDNSTPIPVSNQAGEVIASQPGPLWVMLSGVDEHGLIAEHFLELLAEADANAAPIAEVHTGIPADVLEIRHVGPGGLQRFYHVETVTGEIGWISDFYIRRQAYLFNIAGTTVSIHETPGGPPASEVANVSPVVLLDPTAEGWWQVGSVEGELLGWVFVGFIQESPEEEFLFNTHAHPGGLP